MQWRDNEERIITVTPVAKGLVRPALAAVVLAILVQLGSFHASFIHRHEAWFLLVLVGPYGIVGAAAAYLISAAVGVPALVCYVERNVVGLDGREFLRQWVRVLPAVALQVVAALALRMVAVNLVFTVGAMAVTAAILPVLYLLLGLATPGDRALLEQLIGRLRQRWPSTPR